MIRTLESLALCAVREAITRERANVRMSLDQQLRHCYKQKYCNKGHWDRELLDAVDRVRARYPHHLITLRQGWPSPAVDVVAWGLTL